MLRKKKKKRRGGGVCCVRVSPPPLPPLLCQCGFHIRASCQQYVHTKIPPRFSSKRTQTQRKKKETKTREQLCSKLKKHKNKRGTIVSGVGSSESVINTKKDVNWKKKSSRSEDEEKKKKWKARMHKKRYLHAHHVCSPLHFSPPSTLLTPRQRQTRAGAHR